MAKSKIVITQRAFSSINECVLFLKCVSNEAAKKLYSEIITSIKSLEEFPNAYPLIDGLTIKEVGVRRMPIHQGRYVIIYKYESNIITIYDIIDSRKDNSILTI